MKDRQFSFTINRLEGLPPAKPGQRDLYYDTRSPHLAVRVSDKGVKTFLVYRWLNGRALKRTIGRFPDFTIEQARTAAQQLNSDLAQGKDPLEAKRKEQAQLTLGELFDHYLERYAKDRCVAWEDMVANFNRHFDDWKNRKLTDISRMEVQVRINQLGRDKHYHRANRAHDDLRAVFTWGIKKGLHYGDNPTVGIDRFKLQARERFIKPEELMRFFSVLQHESNTTIRDYILMSLYTGARQANVLAMRWDEIDFDLGTWRIPITKNQESQTVPLTRFALDLLIERSRYSTSEWVFPGKKPGSHLQEPKATWRKVVKLADLSDLRMHDLRRTLGSYMAMSNQSLQIIGKALGHKSHTSTQIYARLANDPVRQAMEKAQNDMFAAAGLLSDLGPSTIDASDFSVCDSDVIDVEIVSDE